MQRLALPGLLPVVCLQGRNALLNRRVGGEQLTDTTRNAHGGNALGQLAGGHAAQTGQGWVIGVFVLSGLLNAAYLLPVLYRIWFLPQRQAWPEEQKLSARFETHWMLLCPPVFTLVLVLLMGLFASTELSPLSWSELIVEREFSYD